MIRRLEISFPILALFLIWGGKVEAQQVQVEIRKQSEWEKGLCADVIVKNPTNQKVVWKVEFQPGGKISQIWNARYSQDPGTLKVTATGVDWNREVPPHGEVKFGFCADKISNGGGGGQTPTSAGLKIGEKTLSQWEGGVCKNIEIFNPTNREIVWRVEVPVKGEIEKVWNANYQLKGGKLVATGVEWNRVVAPHQKREFGYCSRWGSSGQPAGQGTQSLQNGQPTHQAQNSQPTSSTSHQSTQPQTTGTTPTTPPPENSTPVAGGGSFGKSDYLKALPMALQFYEAQRGPGPFPKVKWRRPAVQSDGQDVGRDLSKGWFDAGDHVKFNLPMGYSATMLAWSMLEFPEGYKKAGALEYGKEQVRYVLDYFLNCYNPGKDPNSPADDILYYQVGDPHRDHAFWGPPDKINFPRPTYSCSSSAPCSEVAGEMAAALAAGSLLFKDSDPAYARKLLETGEKIYQFGEQFAGNSGYTAANGFYSSYSGYNDELAWGAVWLYKATGDKKYLEKAEKYIQKAQPATHWAHSWDNVSVGTQLLLYEVTGKPEYRQKVEEHLNHWLSGVQRTKGGLAFLDRWGSLRYASTTAYIGLVAAKHLPNSPTREKYIQFAKSQIDYILGDNPRHSSYLVGFRKNYPKNPHHRGAHDSPTFNIDDPVNNRHTLVGALVGGPKSPNDFDYKDDRHDYVANEVATDYNAGFTGALAGLIQLTP